jgi:PKD repeat protein
LKANLNGCISEVSQRAYQFDKPKAGYTLKSGTCDNEGFVFENTTTIASGLFGNNWDFNDGTVSTEEAPQHMFTSHGTKNVKLVTTSEFGCKDSVTKPVLVRESPVVDFNHDPACSLTPTLFTNTTPDVAGTNPIYKWSFGDGGTSGAESPTHAWSALGPKTVTLAIELDNGCKSSMSKNLVVGVQPKASFEANNVCAGSPVVFENNTTWSQGDITYSWNFGDNTTSTNSDPLKSYNTTITTTYNVTLKASIAGGCEDQITKAVTVNEAPQTCDFDASTDYTFGYYGVKLQPKNGAGNVGGQAGVQYTWVFAGGGTETGSSVSYNFQEDGTYKVTMRAKVLSTGCECSKTIDVVMNRGAVADLNKVGVAVYPNPNAGQFNIALKESFGSMVEITMTNMAGQVVKTQTMANTGLLNVNAGDLADGIYTVSVRSGAQVATSKIHIAR